MAAISLLERSNRDDNSTQTSTGAMQTASTITSAQADHNSGITSVDTQTGIGIGIAIAIAIILLVLGILWLLVIRRKRQERKSGRHTGDDGQRGIFDSFGSTLVSSRHHSIPLQDLHEKDGNDIDGEAVTMAASTALHEASAVPPTREGVPAEMPTIWNEGYRGRSGEQIRCDSQLTLQVFRDSRPGERADYDTPADPTPEIDTPRSGWLESETPQRESLESQVRGASEGDARYTFLMD